MLIPIRTDAPLRHTPVVNYALIFLNIAIFALQKVSATGALGFNVNTFFLDPGNPKLLHFVTYGFLHSSWMHLLGNMVFLYIFGNNVSSKLGQWGYLLFYLAGCVFAGVGYVVLATPNPNGVYPVVVGASGAVSAVTGAFLVLFPRSTVTIFYFFILIGVADIPAIYWIIFSFVWNDVIQAMLGDSNVAHSAHLSGAVFGVLISLGLLWVRLLDRDQYDLLALISRWNRRRQFQAAVASGWDPYAIGPNMGSSNRSGRGGAAVVAPPDPRSMAIMELRAQVAEAMAHRNLNAAVEHYLRLWTIDPDQVLSRNAQLDIGNQLAELGQFQHAARAYDLYLKHYPDADQHAHIELLAGVIYGRYLNNTPRAIERLEHALPRLTSARDVELARSELSRLKSSGGGGGTGQGGM